MFVGYRYFETFARDTVQFPFGFGLSYATFGFSGAELVADDEVRVAVDVTNTGSRAGREVVQLYVQAPDGALGKPAGRSWGTRRRANCRPGSRSGCS